MPFGLDSLKKGSLTVKKVVVQKSPNITGSDTRSPTPRASSSSNNGIRPARPAQAAKITKEDARRSYPTPPAERPALHDRKRSTPVRGANSPSLIDFGDSGDDSEEEILRVTKRVRRETPEDLPARKVRSKAAFDEGADDEVEMIHSEEIQSLDSKVRYQPSFEGLPAGSIVQLQYPSVSQRETFKLIKGRSDASAYNAVDDIHATMKIVIKYYLPEEKREQFDHESTGFPQRLNRAVNKRDKAALELVVNEWNKAVAQMRKHGVIAKQLDSLRRVPAELIERVLNQAHARTVSPEDHQLHTYGAGTNEVYGELLPRFVSQILNDDTKMRPDQVFVDLGSGVGNVVLQAALEAGCESWGCEIKKEYHQLAEAQQREFEARCRLWGLAHGKIRLEYGDFLINTKIREVLMRADVVVVNNEVFSSELNGHLVNLFLDLKEGCKIVSLKSFVPQGHKLSTRNAGNPVNLLQVRRKEYFSGSVSWKDKAGDYFVSTKDSKTLEKFLRRHG